MNKKRKKILIVGGTGFIGYHLAKLCKKKNWHVTSFSKNNPKKIEPNSAYILARMEKVNFFRDYFYKKAKN